MMSQPEQQPPVVKSEFESTAVDQADASLMAEFWDFLRHNKKWWLLPIILFLAMVAILFWLNTTGLAPFIYTLS